MKFIKKIVKRRKAVNQLSQLSDRQLADIGVPRNNIKEFVKAK